MVSAYELQDLRINIEQRIVTLSQFWMSITLAVFGVAIYAAPNLSTPTMVGLVSFYSFVCFANRRAVSGVWDQLDALSQDVLKFVSSDSDAPAFLSGSDFLPLGAGKKGYTVLLVICPITLVGYLVNTAI